jgi:flagellar basal-body rod protein FlgG
MIKALRTAATGMEAQQMNVDTIANNLANVNTGGFKKSRIEFQDILYQKIKGAGGTTMGEATAPTSLEVGFGTQPAATQRLFSEGNITPTGNALDLCIEGDGFFQISMPDGSTAYTRDGAFKLSADGKIVTTDGFFLYPEITIPSDATQISIGVDGKMTVQIVGANEPQEIGQLELVKFINPAGLEAMGHNLFKQTSASGDPMIGTPTQEGLGKINQGSLELSNVEVVEEMVNMIIAQRAYEINSKAIQTSDDMSGIANNLKR